jgi:hypothetical protein
MSHTRCPQAASNLRHRRSEPAEENGKAKKLAGRRSGRKSRGQVTMRAQHPTTADEIDIIVHRQGKPKMRRVVKRASARRDRRTARRQLRH